MLARGLGPDGRGEFALAVAVFSLASTLGNLGQAERLAADLRQTELVDMSSRYWIVGLASAVAALCTFVALQLLGSSVVTSICVSAAVPISSVGLLWRAIAVARGKVLSLAVQAAMPSVLRLALIFALFRSDSLTVFSATSATMLTTSLGVLLIAVIVDWGKSRSSAAGHWVGARFRDRVFSGIGQGLPVVGFALSTAVMLRADIFMLDALSTSQQVGFYAAAVAVTESALALSTAFKNRMQTAAYSATPLTKVRTELSIMLAIALPAVAFGGLVAERFTTLMFGHQFLPAVPALRVLIFAALALILLDTGQGMLAVLGLRTAMFRMSTIGAVATVIFLSLLVPKFGAVGAALASLVAYSMVAAGCWIQAIRTLRVT